MQFNDCPSILTSLKSSPSTSSWGGTGTHPTLLAHHTTHSTKLQFPNTQPSPNPSTPITLSSRRCTTQCVMTNSNHPSGQAQPQCASTTTSKAGAVETAHTP
eukprot:7456171-Ditylum_brightwellii.AAC.1